MDAVTRLRDPRYGMAFLTAVVSLVMALHWGPMLAPGTAVLAAAIIRPDLAVRPAVWWAMAALWAVALVVEQPRMEDHVHLFAAWLVALALVMAHRDDETLVRGASWHARMLVGVAFSAAVAWKLYFGEFVTGVTLRLFMLVDGRFAPLAGMVGLPDGTLERDRGQLANLLDGTIDTMTLAPGARWRLAVVAAATLVIEAVVAASHLAPDSSPLARLRLPSLALFGVTTYAMVPVLPFAALLGVLAIVVARWRHDVMWVLPALVLVAAVRVAFLI